jgi:heat shock protein HslJ
LSSPLDGTTWVPVGSSTGRASLTFADGMVSGCGGINRMGGRADIAGDRIRVGPLASTRMAGPPEAMAAEDLLLRALEAARRWAIVDDRLVLRDESGTGVLELVPPGAPDGTIV